MYKYLAIYVALMAMLSCGRKPPGRTAGNLFPPPYNYDTLAGIYAGSYNGSTISICLRLVTGRTVTGYSLYSGRKRNLSGVMQPATSGFHMVLKEPGNDKADGIYDVVLDTLHFRLTGTWTSANDKNLPARRFSLALTSGPEMDGIAVFADSFYTVNFNSDGGCVYTYYTDTTSGAVAQMQTLRGNWTYAGNCYTIDWQKNNAATLPGTRFPVDSACADSACEYYRKFIHISGRTLNYVEY